MSKEETQIGGYIVFYTEHEIVKEGMVDLTGENVEPGEMKMHLKKKIIPAPLIDKFNEVFGGRLEKNGLSLSGEEIDKFLEENKNE